MGLNLNNGGEYIPHIRYMASTSSWTMSSDNGMIPFQFTQAIFDLENIRTGWGFIGEGEAPEWVMDVDLSTPAPKPQDGREWKRGFRVEVYSGQLFGNTPVREFATTGTGAILGIENLYKQYEDQQAANAGKVPVVEFKGGVPTKVGKGNTSVPTLQIVKFVDRPDALKKDAAPAVAQDSAAPVVAAPVAATASEF